MYLRGCGAAARRVYLHPRAAPHPSAMISYIVGNLFESPAQTLVNTVNTVGVMGKGIALTFKQIYPEMFSEYQELCESGQFKIGRLFLYRTPNKLILNFPTKKDWRHPSKPEYIEAGLKRFTEIYQAAGIRSIAFPPLGCGNGELDFESTVRPIMEDYLAELPIPVFIYAPLAREGQPEHRKPEEVRKWLRSEPQHLPFSEVWGDVLELVGAGREFRTLDGGEAYRVEYVPGEEALEDRLRIRTSGSTRAYRREELEETWQELRHHKLLTRRTSGPRARDVSYILPVLAALSYVDVVRVGDSLDTLTHNPAYALQLASVARAPRQRGLALTA